MKKTFYSAGKLLLSGEYAVLDGAWGLALPTRMGQKLSVSPIKSEEIRWKSFDDEGKIWFESSLSISEILSYNKTVGSTVADKWLQILQTLAVLKPQLFEALHGWQIETQTEFPLHWGLGSSSTLLNNLAVWAEVDAHKLLEKTFGGSGYDLAVAAYQKPLLYRIKRGIPEVLPIEFSPEFTHRLAFVYLNQKQNSRKAIKAYAEVEKDQDFILKISRLTLALSQAEDIAVFSQILFAHEECLSSVLGMPTVKERLFSDYPYAVKSLGAWGGDFVLAVIDGYSQQYFADKGFNTFLRYEEMIKRG